MPPYSSGGGYSGLLVSTHAALGAITEFVSSLQGVAYTHQPNAQTAAASYAVAQQFAQLPQAPQTLVVGAASTSAPQPSTYQTIDRPLVERMIYETATPTASVSGVVTQGDLDQRLEALQQELDDRIDAVSLYNSQALVGAYQAASYIPAQTSVGSSGSGSSSVDWGAISGTLSDQSDLQSALDQKLPLSQWYATTTDALAEGSTNLYYSPARVQSYLDTFDKGYFFSTTSASYFLSQNQNAAFSTSSASYFLGQNQPLAFSTSSASYFLSQQNLFSTSSSDYYLSTKTTDNLAQGSTNKYYSSLLFASDLSATSTDALKEGTINLYFTSARVASVIAGTTTDALREGSSNQYFTNERAQNAISVSGLPLTYSSGMIGINQASDSQSGYLSSTNWTAFNNKIASTSLSAGTGISYNPASGAIANTGIVSNTGDWAGTLAGQTGIYYLANSFSTSSASYFLEGSQGLAFSTSSASYWQSQNNFFSTTSASYFLGQNQNAAFSTSSATYFLLQNQPIAFSTTSASYLLSQNASSTPTIGYLTATTTNATSTFAGGLAVGVSGFVYNWATGFIGVGTANPSRPFNVFGTSANPQVRVSYSGSAYTELQTDAAGDFLVSPTSGIVEIGNGTFEVCSSSVCATPTVALSGNGNLTVDNRLVAGSLEEACPSGYIWVPGESKYGTLPGFCTMKYEASRSGSTAVSTPSGTPWISITQTSAIAQCHALGPGDHLMSEPEWMTIADEITSLDINDLTGSQQFATGHSDNSPAHALSAGDAGTDPVVSGCNLMEPLSDASNAYVASSCEERGNGSDGSTDNDKGYYGTGNDFSQTYSAGTSNKSQLRTAVLPNGAVIWDFAGNVWEWTDATLNFANEAASSTVALDNWAEYNTIFNYHALSYARPDITTWTAATNGIGEMFIGTPSGGISALIRGGGWSVGADDGVFALYLSRAPSDSSAGLGFRCSR